MPSQRPVDAADRFTVGVDFGTLSGRAVVVRVSDGAELGSAVHEYPHAVMDSSSDRRSRGRLGPAGPPPGRLGPAGAARLRRGAAAGGPGRSPGRRRSTRRRSSASAPTSRPAPCCRSWPTGPRCASCPSSPTARTRTSSSGEHHAAQAHADRINALAHARGESWITRYGGLISSEWEFAKGLQLLEEDREVYDRMDHFVEAADWIVWQLAGRYVRNACTAGYKGIYQDGRYPDRDFLAALNPDFAGFARGQGRPRDRPAGRRGRQV